MQTQKNIVLVDGAYNIADSKELLFGLINYKRNFHTLKNFSSELRTGKPDEFAVERRNALAHSLIEVEELYEQAISEGLEFKIDCELKIRLMTPSERAAEEAEIKV